MTDFAQYEPGFDIPALPGMGLDEIQTPCLVLDLDALERNISRMGAHCQSHGIRHRAHGKMHKSVDVLRLQMERGGVDGVCCQKVSEAEVFARAGISDILISNQVRDPARIDRLARLPLTGARISVCVDDLTNVPELSEAAQRHGTTLECLVELECGGRRCGVAGAAEAVALARAIDQAPGLRYGGLQAYHGAAQHIQDHADRAAELLQTFALVAEVVTALDSAGLAPPLVTGAGTGSFQFETASGLYNELQCGSYAFMDADYGRIQDAGGNRLDAGTWENALYVLSSVISHPRPDRAVCDAGLKAMSGESGLPLVAGQPDILCTGISDEHTVFQDPLGRLEINQRLRLIPGHCDPTCNLHDWYVVMRGNAVETLWPVSARGKVW